MESSASEQLYDEIKELKKALEEQQKSKISMDSINEFAETLLNDENINIRYFPDSVEEKLYRNVIKILMSIIKHVVETCKIEFMGHNITMKIQPN